MIAKRIVPCLDVRDGHVVKGVNFAGLKDVNDPVTLARFYNEQGADELVFYDITASAEERGLFTDILKGVASEVFIPLTVGGGINEVSDFERVLNCGADKVREDTGLEALEWIRQGEQLGAGELVINSMDTDGVKQGFDLALLKAVSEITSLPIVASGGAGKMEDFIDLFQLPKIEAGLAASIFHYGEVKIPDLKKQLNTAGIPVRMV